MSTPPFAASHPDVFSPQIVPLDLSTDSLSDFAPQAPVAAARIAAPLPVVTRGPIVLRVPRWAGIVLLAVAAGAVGSLLTLTMIDGGAGRPAGTVAVIQNGAFVEAPAMARPVMPVPARWEEPAVVPPPAARPAARPAAVREDAARTPIRAAAAETPRPAPAPPPARPLPTGTVSVSSAFPVQVLEDGAVVGDSASRLTLAAGTHVLTLVNEALEYRETRTVTVEPRRTLAVNVEVPRGTLHVNARPWADVWIGGRRAGETPLGNVSLPIGTHEVVLRHPQLGESRHTVTVGARTPARLAVELQP